MSFFPADISMPCVFDVTGSPSLRSPEQLWQIVQQFDVANTARYRPRDYDGDGRRETFCNVFLNDVTRALGCEIPRRIESKWMTANDQIDWLRAHGGSAGWIERKHNDSALLAAVASGAPAVVTWRALTGSGHVALIVPTPPNKTGRFVAQAGVICSPALPLKLAFGKREVQYFTHE